MSLWSWDPFSDFFGDTLFDVDRFVDPFFISDRDLDWRRGRRGDRWDRSSRAITRGGETGGGTVTLRPRMDIHENRDSNTVTAMFELPGLSKDNVNIHVADNRLEVSGETSYADEYDEGGFTVRERQVGRFYRSIPLPPGVTEKDVKANFDQGVLTVTFPKTTEETAPKRVTVS